MTEIAPTNTWSTRFLRRTSSAALTTPASERSFRGIVQAPCVSDQIGGSVQLLRRGDLLQATGRAHDSVEPEFLPLFSLVLSHAGATTHDVLDDAPRRHETTAPRRAPSFGLFRPRLHRPRAERVARASNSGSRGPSAPGSSCT